VPETPPDVDFQGELWSDDDADPIEHETVSTSPADVESAGRSCMAIVILAAAIFLLLCLWVGVQAVGIGR
jgi:hypothetical protein